MSRLATGVVMVTCRVDDRPWGITVSSCSSISLYPPIIAVSLTRDTVSATEIKSGGAFGVSLLGEGHLEMARFGSARGQPKFLDDNCLPGAAPTPAVAGALAHCTCQVERALDVGDHRLFLGLVTATLVQSFERPLIYYSRDYHSLGDRTGAAHEETVESLLHPHPMPRQFAPPERLPDHPPKEAQHL